MSSKPNRRTLRIVVGFILACLCSSTCLASSAAVSAVYVSVRYPPFPTAVPLPEFPPSDVLLEGSSAAPMPVLLADAQGVPHLFWYEKGSDGTGLRHRRLEWNAGWSEPEWVVERLEKTVYGPPKVALDPQGSACVFWLGAYGASGFMAPSDIFWRCALGATLSAEQSAAGPQDWYGDEFSPAFAADGRMVFAYRRTDESLYIGDSALSQSGLHVKEFRLISDSSGGCHAAWAGETSEILHHRFAPDCGTDWRPETAVTDSETQLLPGSDPLFAAAADRKGSIHIGWVGLDAVFYRRWDPTGGWLNAEKAHGEKGLFVLGLALAADGDGSPVLLWEQSVPASHTSGIFYGRRGPGGLWSASDPVGSGSLGYISLAAPDSRLCLAWQTEPDPRQLNYSLVFLSVP